MLRAHHHDYCNLNVAWDVSNKKKEGGIILDGMKYIYDTQTEAIATANNYIHL